MNVVFWGTYDLGKPRTRILIRGLRESGVSIIECHKDVWAGVEDKTQIPGISRVLVFALRCASAYPRLIVQYLRLPKHDVVIVGYLGHLDVLILWPFARARGIPIVWDAFLSLYDTVVTDRRLIGPRNPLAWLLFGWEWLSCRAATLVLLDTRAHTEYFVRSYRLSSCHVRSVWIGAEPEVFPHLPPKPTGRERIVLFYGQFIPLHGIHTILQAARLTEEEPIRWILIGKGQDARRIDLLLRERHLPKLEWIPWVDYSRLCEWIAKADVCLGIFGTSDKAARVIPNKAFQIIMSGRPLVTRDSPAMRELAREAPTGAVTLVPPGDAFALADAVRSNGVTGEVDSGFRSRISPPAIGAELASMLAKLV
jgi:glycosyltransferase involved in cell wall biosynthesis